MKDEKSKMLKIMNELVRFYLKSGNHSVRIASDLTDHEGIVSLEGCCTKIDEKKLEDLNDILNSPRKDEAEEYYWNLVGSNDFSEIHLLGSLVNEGEVKYDGNVLKMRVKRYF